MTSRELAQPARELTNVNTQALRDVESLLFKLATSVGQLKKQVNLLGGPRDTIEHRRHLAEANTAIQTLAKDIKGRLEGVSGSGSRASAGAPHMRAAGLPSEQQAKSRKLLSDFSAILADYKATQKIAADRQASSLPRVPPQPQAATLLLEELSASSRADGTADAHAERVALLQAQAKREEARLNNNIQFNEAVIEERDEGIAEIQRQIVEVHEMFQDLAVLIADQGEQVTRVDDSVAATAVRVVEGTAELAIADKRQARMRNRCIGIWVTAAIIASVIIVLLFV